MKKIHTLFPLLAAIIVFLMGYNALKGDNLREGIMFLSLAIILFGSAGTLSLSIQINELKEEIKKQNSDTKPDDKVV